MVVILRYMCLAFAKTRCEYIPISSTAASLLPTVLSNARHIYCEGWGVVGWALPTSMHGSEYFGGRCPPYGFKMNFGGAIC